MNLKILSLLVITLTSLSAIADEVAETDTELSTTNNALFPTQPSSDNKYLDLMNNPDEDDQPLYDRLFDQKLSNKLRERMANDQKAMMDDRSNKGYEPKRSYLDQQKIDENNKQMANWFVKKIGQYQLEKSMEEAPKGSTLNYAHSARAAIQSYDVKISKETKLTGGYDLPTNKLNSGLKSTVYGNHFMNVQFDENKIGPQDFRDVYYTATYQLFSLNINNKYSFFTNTDAISFEQPIILNEIKVAYRYEQDLDLNTSYASQFVGIAYKTKF